jgi:hypothetical protein
MATREGTAIHEPAGAIPRAPVIDPDHLACLRALAPRPGRSWSGVISSVLT